MVNIKQKIVERLVILIGILSAVACIIGIFDQTAYEYAPVVTSFNEEIQLYQKGLYARDSVSAAIQAIAQDAVTLFIGIPLLVVSFVMIKKKKKSGLFLLSGVLGYFLYTYMSYSFLMTFNVFYLIYVLLMVLSFYAFIVVYEMLRESIDIRRLAAGFPKKMTYRFLWAVGIMILLMWLGRIVPAMISGKAPVGLENYSTLVIQSLDLGVVVPACFVIGYLLKKSNPKGYILSGVLVMKGEMMAAAVSAMGISMKLHGVEISTVELIVFPCIFIFCSVFVIKIIAHVYKEFDKVRK